ncbi:hypothetical protein GCM10010300_71960 [Streptomyces olivaceoviridis]|nr:hypothetical protein GCM10010300_71960 [Streptomyces olivaceoviridis]
MGAVPGRGRLQRVTDGRGLPGGGADRWRRRERDPGRQRGWCLTEAAGPFLVQGPVAAVLGFAAADG